MFIGRFLLSALNNCCIILSWKMANSALSAHTLLFQTLGGTAEECCSGRTRPGSGCPFLNRGYKAVANPQTDPADASA